MRSLSSQTSVAERSSNGTEPSLSRRPPSPRLTAMSSEASFGAAARAGNGSARWDSINRWLGLAAVSGAVHAGFSLYWASGGTWLLDTLGARIVTAFAGLEWVLYPLGLVKLVGAVAPLWLYRRGRPARRFWRLVCWLGAALLVVWGGVNAVVGNLVIGGVITSTDGFDRAGMIGHAYLWDPLFLAWGIALVAGLITSRGDTSAPPPRSA